MRFSPSTRFVRAEEVPQKWFIVDLSGKTLGRAASQIARIIRGKHKPCFTPNYDLGDYVVVINAERVNVTGKRLELKEYYHNTMYPGGARVKSFKELVRRMPEAVIEHAVRGMLPHNRLGRKMMKKLKVYAGASHPHAAQKPEVLPI